MEQVGECNVLGKDMDDEQFRQLGGGNSIMSWNEESLLSETVYHYQDSGKLGSCSIKSIEIDSQRWSRIGSCQRRPYGLCHFAFDLAQVVQDWT
jgi:hypothetical protein